MKPLVLILLIMASFSSINTKAGNLASRLDSLFKSRYTEYSPGAQFLVAKDGKVLYENASGVADFEKNEPITQETRFNIASISKQFTAMSILKLQEAGKLSIDDPVSKYFPDYDKNMFGKITLRHLMSHTSGIPDARPRDDRQWMLRATDEECIEYMKGLHKGKFVSGTAYDYVNPTFQLLYAVIEQVTGEAFTDFQQENLFDKAGMRDSYYFDATVERQNESHAYIKEDNESANDDRDVSGDDLQAEKGYIDKFGNVWHECDYGEVTFFATKADGGIYSTAHDLLSWEQALQTGVCVSSESLQLAYTPQIEVSGKWCNYQNRQYVSYGLGFFIDKQPGYPKKVYHTGDNGGYQTYLAKFPEQSVVVILLENRCDYNRLQFATEVDRILKEEGLLR